MAHITVEYNVRNNKFVHIGKDALGYSSESKALILSQREIMQIVSLYEKGVYIKMINESCILQKIKVSKSEGVLSRFFGKKKPKKSKDVKSDTESETETETSCKKKSKKPKKSKDVKSDTESESESETETSCKKKSK